jgi:hypothetical protein
MLNWLSIGTTLPLLTLLLCGGFIAVPYTLSLYHFPVVLKEVGSCFFSQGFLEETWFADKKHDAPTFKGLKQHASRNGISQLVMFPFCAESQSLVPAQTTLFTPYLYLP